MQSRKDATFIKEQNFVSEFLSKFGLTGCTLIDPNKEKKEDSGIDVLLLHQNRKIGFQVTEFHNDDGLNHSSRGSPLRRMETINFRNNVIQGQWLNINPIPALKVRISDKVNTSQKYTFNECDEAILLIAASIPQEGGALATTLIDRFSDLFNLEVLDQETTSILKNGKYSRVYIFKMMGFAASPSAIYEWSKQLGWKKLELNETTPDNFLGYTP